MLGRGRPNASHASPLLSARLDSLVFLSTRSICISLASIHPSLPRDALAGELRAQGSGRRELRRELHGGSEEAAPEEMALGSSVASIACGMPPHTPPSLLLSRAPVHHRHASLRGRPANAQSRIPRAAAPYGGRSCSRAPVELCAEAEGVELPRRRNRHPCRRVGAPRWAAASQGGSVGRGARQQQAIAPPMAKARRMRRICLLFWTFFTLQLLYIDVVTVFLTCCNRSSSGCNCFSFMFANRCAHVASVFLRCCKCLMRIFQNYIKMFRCCKH
jgi:hypothetical protein